jgi:hypothetical protein
MAQRADSGLVSLIPIAGHYRIAADPFRPAHDLGPGGRRERGYRPGSQADRPEIAPAHCRCSLDGDANNRAMKRAEVCRRPQNLRSRLP